jgi:3-oxoacyl-[acyl-carrier-protein] synthase II
MVKSTDHRGRPRVVVTGLGLVTPCGTGLERTWPALIAGKSGIKPITRFDATQFDTRFGGEVHDFEASRWMDPKEIRRNDLFIQFACAAAE